MILIQKQYMKKNSLYILKADSRKYILGIAEEMVIAKESNGNIQVEEIMESK